MNMARSSGYSAVAVEPASFADRALMRSVIRWAVLGAAGVIALMIALTQSMAASAATTVTYDSTTTCIQINLMTCVPIQGYTTTAPSTYLGGAYVGGTYVGGTTYVGSPTYIAPATTSTSGSYLVSSTFDPRYCGGVVNIWNEGGNLIDRCPDGTRVIPIYSDYGPNFVGGNFLGANYLGGAFVNNGITCNGLYGCPYGGRFNGNFAFNGNFSYLNGNVCNVNFNCGAFNTFPAGGTVSGGVVYYNDNRFCGDGKVAFVPNRGYFCQNGGALVTNGVNNVNCGNFFFNGCGIWRGFEADAAPAAPVVAHAAVVAPASPAVAPAAPVVAPAAPVVAPAAAVVAPAAPVVAPAAPVSAKTATALNAPQSVQVDPTERR
ncbi:MAG: hypothetical protein ACR2JW_01220 [Thermomicrobiales bacterium]